MKEFDMWTIDPQDWGVLEMLVMTFMNWNVCVDEVDYVIVGCDGASMQLLPVDEDMVPIQPCREVSIPFESTITLTVY
jgi:hypothetical protein